MLEGSDPSTFSIVADKYSKDSKQVYYSGDAIDEADPASMEMIGSSYFTDKKSVFYQDKLIAPVSTDMKFLAYSILKIGPNIYNRENLIQGVDIASFEFIGGNYFKDKNSIYSFEGKVLVGANPIDYKLIAHNYLASGTKLFYGDKEVVGADVNSFEKLFDNYYADNNGVYSGADKIPGATAQNSMKINNYLSRLGNKVFANNQEIIGLDVATFEVVHEYLSKDKDNVYSFNHVFNDADPETFVVLSSEGRTVTKDKQYVWIDGGKLAGADAATFKVLNSVYSKDKNQVYEGYKVLQGVDPSTFSVD